MGDPARTDPVWISEPPAARTVEQHTGIAAAAVIADIDAMTAERDATRAAFTAAVGFYDCPCGSEFEFGEGSTLEEYAALNRWLGRHVGVCGVEPVVVVADDSKLSDARAEVAHYADLNRVLGAALLRATDTAKNAVAQEQALQADFDELVRGDR